jgi:hypothetical protein
MSNEAWTDEENDLIVADYFAMLADDIAGRPYSKAEHRRRLLPLLNQRSEGSVEFKHQNISAALKGLGEDWIPGYKPAVNFQMSLVDAVARWLASNPAWLGRMPGSRPATGLREAPQIWVGPPPTLSNQPPPQELEQMLASRASSTWRAATSAIAPSAARAKNACSRTSGRRYGRRGAMTWRAQCAGCRRRMATARATTSRVSSKTGGHAD